MMPAESSMPGTPRPGTPWYVVQCHPRAEAVAEANLRRQGYRTYCPRYLKKRRHARRVETVTAPFFPCYLFVTLDLERQRWTPIRSTVGVRQIIAGGDGPTPVPDGIVEAIMERQNDAGMIDTSEANPFSHGDRVRVTDGAFADLEGLFDCSMDEHRVILLLDLLGRSVRVKLPTLSVEAV